MTTTKKKAPADPLVAATTILLDGKAFEAGERITRVGKDQLDRAVADRRVVRESVFNTLSQGVAAPELSGHEDDAPEGDGEGEGEGAQQ